MGRTKQKIIDLNLAKQRIEGAEKNIKLRKIYIESSNKLKDSYNANIRELDMLLNNCEDSIEQIESTIRQIKELKRQNSQNIELLSKENVFSKLDDKLYQKMLDISQPSENLNEKYDAIIRSSNRMIDSFKKRIKRTEKRLRKLRRLRKNTKDLISRYEKDIVNYEKIISEVKTPEYKQWYFENEIISELKKICHDMCSYAEQASISQSDQSQNIDEIREDFITRIKESINKSQDEELSPLILEKAAEEIFNKILHGDDIFDQSKSKNFIDNFKNNSLMNRVFEAVIECIKNYLQIEGNIDKNDLLAKRESRIQNHLNRRLKNIRSSIPDGVIDESKKISPTIYKKTQKESKKFIKK